MPYHKLPKFIASEVGTSDAYVRTVARQRLGRGVSEADRRYLQSPLGKACVRRQLPRRRQYELRRYHDDPIFREKKKAASLAYYYRKAEARAS